MKRRRRQSDGSLDSLLDTMTNVVGILVIVLVVTQLGVGEAVKRVSQIEGPLAELTPQDVELAEWEAENATRQLATLKEKHEGLDVQVSVDETTLKLDQQSVEQVRED